MNSGFKLFIWREDLGDWASHFLVVARDQNEAKKVLLEYMIERWQDPKEREGVKKYWLKLLSKEWEEINIIINTDKPQVLKELN